MTVETTQQQAPVTQQVTTQQGSEPSTRVEQGSNSNTNISNNSLDNSSNNINTNNVDTNTTNKPLPKDTASQVNHFLSEAGLDVESVVKDFTETGTLSLESMKALIDKHGEAVAGLVVEQVKGLYKNAKAQAEARDKAVFEQVQKAFEGITEQTGEETWAELSGWAKENIPNEQRADLNKMLGKGGLQAKLAVDYLIATFKQSETYSQPAELLGGDATVDSFGLKPLTKDEYLRELNVLLAKGHDYNTSPEIRKLDARRQQGMRRGL